MLTVLLAAAMLGVGALSLVLLRRDLAFLAVTLFVLSLPAGDVGIGPLQVVQVTSALAAAGVIAVEAARGDLVPPPWQIGLPMGAIVVATALATQRSPVHEVTFNLDLALLTSLLLVVAVHSVVSTPRRLLTLAVLTVGAGAVVGFRSVSGAGEATTSAAGAIVTGRAVGIFGQPNELGIFCAMLLPISVALLLVARTRRQRLLAFVGVAGLGAGLTVSLSRGAWFGGLVGLLAFWAFLPDRRRFVGPVAGLVVVGASLLVVLAPVPFVGVLNERIASAVDGSTNPYDERPEIYAEARRQITQSPVIGHGPGSFTYVAQELAPDGYNLSVEHAHNLVLTTWAEEGLVGVLALAGLVAGLASLLLRGSAGLRERIDEPVPRLVTRLTAGTTAGLTAVLAHGVIDYPLRNPVTFATVWFVVGLAAATSRVGRAHARTAGTASADRAAAGVRALRVEETAS